MKKAAETIWDAILIVLLVLFVCINMPDAFGAGPEQAVFGGPVSGAPWYMILVITLAPGAAAVSLTIGCVWLIRRVNRDVLKREPLDALTLIKWTVAIGALYGPLMQWGLQRVSSDLTGLPVYWELIAIAPFITGVASMIIYEFVLMPYLRKKHRGIYEALKVRHKSSMGHIGDTANGDLTRFDGAPVDYEDPDRTPTPK